MLEWLLLALFSDSASQYFPSVEGIETPRIEILEPSALPLQKAEQVAPKLIEDPRTSLIAMDLDSGKVLLKKNQHRSQPIASLTKLMTALLILENHEMDEVVTIPEEVSTVQGAQIDLYAYEKMTVRTLLESVLIASANDSAVALAVYHAGDEASFAKEMNVRAKELGLDSAHFLNSTGLDIYPEEESTTESIRGNVMSAEDILALTRRLLEYDFVRENVAKKEFEGISADGQFSHQKDSTNQLLGTFVNVKGVKTGYTELAGECLSALGETKDGHEVITVMLGSTDRFGETKKLLSWIYDSFEWR